MQTEIAPFQYQKRTGPIIESPLDTDSYKFTMQQMIYHNHPDIDATFSFINRTKSVRLAEHVDLGELRENLEHVRRSVRFDVDDLDFMANVKIYGQRMFKQDYIDFLRTFSFPEYELSARDGQIDLRFYGKWPNVTMWEVPGMVIVNQLYIKSLMKDYTDAERAAVWAEGQRRLFKKIDVLEKRGDISFCDFGTRRRASRNWQDYIVGVLSKEFPPTQFTGTSNVYLAKKHGIKQKGTNAHELGMVYSSIFYDDDEKDPLVSQKRVLEDWEKEYGLALSIFLPDTYSSEYFFENTATPDQIRRWKGSRQDSGDPLAYGDARIADYVKHGIDPMSKMIIFADGLVVPNSMIEIADYFRSRIPVTFGPGTNLTNDVGFKPVSIIIKPTWAAGHNVVKLSDNVEKATGDPAEIERKKRQVGYDVKYTKECEV